LTRDLYALLGVAPDASTEAIAAVCAHKLAEATDHNDKVVLRHAREVLCNPATRATYDLKLREQRNPGISRQIFPEPDEISPRVSPHRRLVIFMLLGIVALGFIAWLWAQRATTTARIVSRTPTVVVVEPTRLPGPATTPRNMPGGQDSVLTPETLYAATAPSVVVIEAINGNGQPYGRGSGVVIGPQRLITNCHVIDGAISIHVKAGNSEYTATSGTSDTHLDLCVLLVEGLSAPEVKRGSVKSLQVGQTVYAIGAPQGLDRTLSQGLISALRETPEGTVIQTSAAISPGSSGGGLFDAEGRLIGITTFQTKMGQNLNFAVPVDWLETMRTR
jgi:serine protease Do